MLPQKIALVYDRVNKWGGAERLLLSLKKAFPQAPLYTSVYWPPGAGWARGFSVKPAFLNRLPLARKHHELFAWLMPLAFESLDFSDYDLVISVSSAEAKGIITRPGTVHICYCLTPTRYLWSGAKDYQNQPGFGLLNLPGKTGLKLVNPYLSGWDRVAAFRPDYFLAISETVKKRIKKYYQRDSEVVYPPVDLGRFRPAKQSEGDFFLIISRLVSYKRIDLAVEAFNRLGWKLKIIGIGNQLKELKRKAGQNIEFLGLLTDKELISYYYSCRAVICPQDEDFGLVPLEAQACGKPVIAFASGGVTETVIKGKTGDFFYPQTAGALVERLKAFKPEKYLATACRQNAIRFNETVFIKTFCQKVEEIWEKSIKKS